MRASCLYRWPKKRSCWCEKFNDVSLWLSLLVGEVFRNCRSSLLQRSLPHRERHCQWCSRNAKGHPEPQSINFQRSMNLLDPFPLKFVVVFFTCSWSGLRAGDTLTTQWSNLFSMPFTGSPPLDDPVVMTTWASAKILTPSLKSS